MPFLKMVSNDRKLFRINHKYVEDFSYVKFMVDKFSLNTLEKQNVFLPYIDARTLHLVLKWALCYRNHIGNDAQEFSEWEISYIKQLELVTVLDILTATKYLGIRRLAKLVSEILPEKMKGNTPKEITDKYKCESSDFMPMELHFLPE